MLQSFFNSPPIRKVVVAAVTAGALYVIDHVLHVKVTSRDVQSAVEAALPIIAAYATPDPRVS